MRISTLLLASILLVISFSQLDAALKPAAPNPSAAKAVAGKAAVPKPSAPKPAGNKPAAPKPGAAKKNGNTAAPKPSAPKPAGNKPAAPRPGAAKKKGEAPKKSEDKEGEDPKEAKMLLKKMEAKELLLLTVATDNTEGFRRYLRSAKVNGLVVKVVGMGEEWRGGEMADRAGGGHKINLLRKEVEDIIKEEEKSESDGELVLMFTDAYDVLLLEDSATVLGKFKTHFPDARVVFSAEPLCWPDVTLAEKYPEVGNNEKRFLNSGGFIGYASEIHKILQHAKVSDTDDNQLYYTNIFLDPDLRKKFGIQLDTKSVIFQNLNGALGDLEIRFEDQVTPFLVNVFEGHRPSVVHANGPTKNHINTYGNYVPGAWNANDQCTACWEENLDWEENFKVEAPQVVLAVFIEQPTPFIEEFFQKLLALDYPKESIDLYLHVGVAYHEEDVAHFVEDSPFHSVQLVPIDSQEKEADARNAGLQYCQDLNCDYYFNVDSVAHLDNPKTLRLLIEQNRALVAPVIVRPYHTWSNFWGALNKDGFYRRSHDYMDIVNAKRTGLWNVPCVNSVYLIKGSVLNSFPEAFDYVDDVLDPGMALCAGLRDAGIFIHASNRFEFGHLIHTEGFAEEAGRHNNDELWEMESNRYDWEKRYIHPDYWSSLEEGAAAEEPCPDVYWFPIVTHRFADELVDECESYGKWSGGSNKDARLQGGYENVPTRDIHMIQIEYEKHWLHFLDTYVRPLQEKVFIGYDHRPPRATMNFMVRYKAEEQPSLRPHHDISTYTINIAMNQAGVDYQGGGCGFLRYNCNVTTTKKGWMFMHPGRLTHFHEGLPTTQGTRYIMISFVDP